MKKIKKIGIVILWLAVWQVLSMVINQKIILVSPIETVKRIFELALTKGFWVSTANSFWHIGAGFCLAIVSGIILAIIARKFPICYDFISPLLTVIKAIPVASFTLIVFLWLKASLLSVFISFIMVLPIIFFATYEGIGKADTGLLQMAKVFKVKKSKILKEIYIPATTPFLVSAISVSVGFAFKSGIAAEVIAISQNSIGADLYSAKLILESADIFALTAVIILISKLAELIIIKLLHKLEKAVI